MRPTARRTPIKNSRVSTEGKSWHWRETTRTPSKCFMTSRQSFWKVIGVEPRNPGTVFWRTVSSMPTSIMIFRPPRVFTRVLATTTPQVKQQRVGGTFGRADGGDVEWYRASKCWQGDLYIFPETRVSKSKCGLNGFCIHQSLLPTLHLRCFLECLTAS